MGSFDDLCRGLAADPQLRGRQFEHIAKWFLENDPVYSRELKRVWLWKDWPGRWGADAGIDLVATDRNGALWAIQAKAYDPKYRVSKKDVDTFLAESGREVFTYRMLIATTDLINHTGERTIQQQEKRCSFLRLNDLRAASVDWPESPEQLRPAKRRRPARPRPHQREAIRHVVTGFKDSDRGQLIMACGTGKTLTGLFIAEKLESKRTLVLSPSLSLLKQTMNEWRANAGTDFLSLPVCSDVTVRDVEDAAIAHTSDLGVPVTTDPATIADFLRHRGGPPRVVFATYQSSPQVSKAFHLPIDIAAGRKTPEFDLIIADEAHRVAGPVRSEFATVLDEEAIRGQRRLFMTATPRRFTGRVIKAAREADFGIASMDDEAKFGPVFHTLSFGEAIERDLLTDYQVAVIGVDDATYLKWAQKGALVTRDGGKAESAAALAGQIGLAKAMRKYGLHRVISFHSRVARAREFADSLPGVVDWMPSRRRPAGSLWCRHASGEMPAGDRYILLQSLARLPDDSRGLLANARCLAEGVDVPTLDGVAFIDPRGSEVDIVQAVGRAIRKSETKTIGTVVIPVFIDTDADPHTALNSSAFKPVWDVVTALRAHDTELGLQLDTLRREMARGGGRPRLPDKIHFDIPATVGIDFARAFDVRLVERTTLTWEQGFQHLADYIAHIGHSRVPRSCVVDGFRLGAWVNTQRTLFGKGTLDADRRERLAALDGWTWDTLADKWEDGFQRLQQYVEVHGHARVPFDCRCDGYRLGQWVVVQRQRHSAGTLEHDRQRRLQNLTGWSWNPLADQWEEGFNHLLRYVEAHGDALVPSGYIADGFNLGDWISLQRQSRKQGTLEPGRESRLAQLSGWTWEPGDRKWELGFAALVKFVELHGHARVPSSYTIDGYKIGQWVVVQRHFHAKGRLSEERAERLRNLPGWAWDSRTAQWEEGFARLLDYIEEHSNAAVPVTYSIDGFKLGGWVNTQRDFYAKGTLDEERRQRLQHLPGWSWDPRTDQWEKGFARLLDYVKQNGHSRVPTAFVVDGFKLGGWVSQQRTTYAKGTLTADRRRRLKALPGWTWKAR